MLEDGKFPDEEVGLGLSEVVSAPLRKTAYGGIVLVLVLEAACDDALIEDVGTELP